MRFKNPQEEVDKLKQELAEKDKQIRELEVMHRINEEATGVVDLKKTLQLIVDEACKTFNAEIGSIMFLDAQKKELTIQAARGLNQDVIRTSRIKAGEGISGWIAKYKAPLLVIDVEKDHRFSKISSEKYYTKSLIAAPISSLGEFLGVININNKKTKEVFTEHDLSLLVAIAKQATIIINNANNYQKLQEIYMGTVTALTEAIDTRDHYTKNHSEHVTKYVMEIAREMGLDEDRLKILNDAAKLHDIGKIGVHDYILMKPEKLTPEECDEVKLHTLKGVKILQPLTFLNDSIKIIRSHHERYDGKGYPDGKKDRNIPLEARIMAVADSFDAMTTERPYRKTLTIDEAKKELVENKGKQFDPEIVDTFLKCLDKERYNI